jgi:hypothetical protein
VRGVSWQFLQCVRAVKVSYRLVCIASGKNHCIIRRDVALRSAVPPDMHIVWAALYPASPHIFIAAKTNKVNY